MEFILSLDISVFYFLNKTLANSFFNWFFPIITSQKNWTPIYLFLLLFLVIKYKKNGALIAILIIISVGLTDFVGNEMKDLIGRLRPCKVFGDINLLVKCGSGKAFPSLHAANNFAMAFVLTRFFRNNAWIFYTLASLIAFSRVIVGVHYPLDILGGAVLGTLIAYITIFFQLISQKLLSKKNLSIILHSEKIKK